MSLLSIIQKEITAEKWSEFINKLKLSGSKVFPDQISIKKFFKLLASYNVKMTKEEKDDLVECFHLKDEGNQHDITMTAIVNFDKTKAVSKEYK